MKGTKIDEVEGFDTPVDPDECDKARLIGEIIAEWLLTLGEDRAWVRDSVVEIGSEAVGPRSRLRGEVTRWIVLDAPRHGCQEACSAGGRFTLSARSSSDTGLPMSLARSVMCAQYLAGIALPGSAHARTVTGVRGRPLATSAAWTACSPPRSFRSCL